MPQDIWQSEDEHVCPECKGPTHNVTASHDGTRMGLDVLPCDSCDKACPECGNCPTVKVDGLCADCKALEVLP